MKINELPTPCYVIDEGKLEDNLKILRYVQDKTGAKILLAQKCFSAFCEYDLIGRYISGTTASGLFEARLGYEKMHKENHVYSPAYREQDMEELCRICDHIIFNSKAQLLKYAPLADLVKEKSGKRPSLGVRINPECSTQKDHEIYDPCAKNSRMGIKACDIDDSIMSLIDGLHFHTLCEQDSDDLEITLKAVEEKFGDHLYKVKWLNMGGGHHITREGYDIDRLIRLIKHMREKYDLEIYLEPGEAVALNAKDILILDTSAACHMPDVLEMPYTPPLKDSAKPGEKKYDYRLSCNTCLAGDVIGDYSFDHEIHIGDRLIFEDMAIYSMVKNNTFNGIPLPAIAAMDATGECRIIKEFGYEDFKNRLS